MGKGELLEQLYAIKYSMERAQDRAAAKSKYDALQDILKRHRFAGHFIKRDIMAEMCQCYIYVESLNDRISEMEKRASAIMGILPSGLITSREYVDAAIDDVIMGRASSVEDVLFCYNQRRDVKRESFEVQRNQMEGRHGQ